MENVPFNHNNNKIVVIIIIFILENWFCAQISKFLCMVFNNIMFTCSGFHEAKIWSPVLQFSRPKGL